MSQNPLDKARQLIVSLTTPEDAKSEIDTIEKLEKSEQAPALTALYNTAQPKAAAGDTTTISIILRVLEHFGDRSHDRMLLHYIAQAEANKALKELQSENHPNHHDMVLALQLIAEAFADADEINTTSGIS